MNDVWAMVLAAGESTRMKTPKMLLPFRGSTIIETAIRNIVDSEISNILVVLGSSGREIAAVIENLPVTHCFNDKYKEGMLSSVKCGLRNLPSVYESVLVFPGDQPMIGADVIKSIVSAHRKTGRGIVIPLFNKKRGHPVLIDFKYRMEINRLDEKEGLRSLSRKFSDDVYEVETDSPGILKDIDTPGDYQDVTNKTE